jgi:hypothetical protein
MSDIDRIEEINLKNSWRANRNILTKSQSNQRQILTRFSRANGQQRKNDILHCAWLQLLFENETSQFILDQTGCSSWLDDGSAFRIRK